MTHARAVLGLALTASMLGTPHSGGAQTLFGHVLDSLTGRPLPSATVILLDSVGTEVRYELTDSTGRFVLKASKGGRYQVCVDQLGYRALVSDTFDLAKDERWERCCG